MGVLSVAVEGEWRPYGPAGSETRFRCRAVRGPVGCGKSFVGVRMPAEAAALPAYTPGDMGRLTLSVAGESRSWVGCIVADRRADPEGRPCVVFGVPADLEWLWAAAAEGPKPCTCPIDTLLRSGCRCGGV